jgi:hypothetical protein
MPDRKIRLTAVDGSCDASHISTGNSGLALLIAVERTVSHTEIPVALDAERIFDDPHALGWGGITRSKSANGAQR